MLTAVQVWVKEPPVIKMLRLCINVVGVEIVECKWGISANSTERGPGTTGYQESVSCNDAKTACGKRRN
jgi:hypothetical protein